MDSSKQQKKRRPVRRKPRKWLITLWVIVSLISLMLLAVGGVGLYVWNALQPPPAGEPIRVEITKGMSAGRVVNLLEDKHLIKDGLIFKYYLQLKKEGDKFQAGVYELTPGMKNSDIIAKLNKGETVPVETVRFTIPEGYTVQQIAEKLANEKLVNKERFLELAASKRAWGDIDAIRSIPEDDRLTYWLEGYLFPETYEVKIGSTEEEIITRLLQEMDRKLATLPEGWQDEVAERELNLHQVVTIASLLEREVVVNEELALVSGVISNRLRDGMMLQIDATVQYALGEQKDRLLNKDLKIDSPYNTYLIKGLPPGPIAAPSIAAIEAAIFPEASKYLFYVTKKDGSNTHLFAETYKQHQKNIALSEK